MNSKLSRRFWKTVAPFFPHRSKIGRVIRARGCKLGPTDDYLAYEARRINKKFVDFPPNTEVLCLGSSHVDNNIDPAFFTKFRVAGAGVRNGDLYQAVNIYRALSKKWPRAKGQCVLVGLDFWMSSLQSEFTGSYFLTTILHCVAGVAYRSSLMMKNSETIVRDAPYSSDSRGRSLTSTPLHYKQIGETQEQVCHRANNHLRACRHEATEVAHLDQLKKLVEADGRRLIIMYPPVRSDYWAECIRHYTKDALWKPFDPVTRGLPLLDYTVDQIPDTLFADCDHLSPEGRQYLANMLERDLPSLTNT